MALSATRYLATSLPRYLPILLCLGAWHTGTHSILCGYLCWLAKGACRVSSSTNDMGLSDEPVQSTTCTFHLPRTPGRWLSRGTWLGGVVDGGHLLRAYLRASLLGMCHPSQELGAGFQLCPHQPCPWTNRSRLREAPSLCQLSYVFQYCEYVFWTPV